LRADSPSRNHCHEFRELRPQILLPFNQSTLCPSMGYLLETALTPPRAVSFYVAYSCLSSAPAIFGIKNGASSL
jgi:hypothetical protein